MERASADPEFRRLAKKGQQTKITGEVLGHSSSTGEISMGRDLERCEEKVYPRLLEKEQAQNVSPWRPEQKTLID